MAAGPGNFTWVFFLPWWWEGGEHKEGEETQMMDGKKSLLIGTWWFAQGWLISPILKSCNHASYLCCVGEMFCLRSYKKPVTKQETLKPVLPPPGVSFTSLDLPWYIVNNMQVTLLASHPPTHLCGISQPKTFQKLELPPENPRKTAGAFSNPGPIHGAELMCEMLILIVKHILMYFTVLRFLLAQKNSSLAFQLKG